MTAKILLIKNIQSHEEWLNDCEQIARKVVNQLNYPVPDSIFTTSLIKNLRDYIFCDYFVDDEVDFKDKYFIDEIIDFENIYGDPEKYFVNKVLSDACYDAVNIAIGYEENLERFHKYGVMEDTPEFEYADFEFNLSDDEYLDFCHLIDKSIPEYYQTEKKELINKLELLDKDIVWIYPSYRYYNILYKFYKPNNKYFICHWQREDKDCIKEFCKNNKIDDYKFIKF